MTRYFVTSDQSIVATVVTAKRDADGAICLESDTMGYEVRETQGGKIIATCFYREDADRIVSLFNEHSR